jgi:hypothetical protein
MGVFQMLFEGRIEQPSIAGDDSADAKSTGEQTMNNESKAKQHTTALTTDLPWLVFPSATRGGARPPPL